MTGNRKAAKRKVSFVLPVPAALLHQGNYVRNGISAVLSKPFCKDRHQSLHVEGHDIRPIAFRHAIAIQNRCKDMLKHPFVDDRAPLHFPSLYEKAVYAPGYNGGMALNISALQGRARLWSNFAD